MDMQTPPSQGMAPAAEEAAQAAPQGYCIQICVLGDGTFKVTKGEMPPEMPAPAADPAMGGDGEQPTESGQTADNIGDALKLALDVYDKAGGQESEDQFNAGFGGTQKPAAPGGM